MKATELVKRVSEFIAQHGDLDVYYVSAPDDDGDEVVELTDVHLPTYQDGSHSILLSSTDINNDCDTEDELCPVCAAESGELGIYFRCPICKSNNIGMGEETYECEDCKTQFDDPEPIPDAPEWMLGNDLKNNNN